MLVRCAGKSEHLSDHTLSRRRGLLFLGLRDQLSECINRRDIRRTKSIFRDIAPNRWALERIVPSAAVNDEHVLGWPNLHLRIGTLGLRAGISWIVSRRLPGMTADPAS